MALYFKLAGYGPVLSWIEVFAPYIMLAIWLGIQYLIEISGIKDKVGLIIYKFIVKRKVDRIAKKTKRQVEAARSGNPGSFNEFKRNK